MARRGDGPTTDHPYDVQDAETVTSSDGTASSSLVWRKARMSVNNGACVEVALHAQAVLIRDSKDPHGPILSCAPEQWRAFLQGARQGDLGRLG